MADLDFNINIKEIVESLGNKTKALREDLTKSVENLANMTHSKTLEIARDELISLSQMYMENVEFSNPAPNLWVVTLKEKALWIEEGRKGGFMKELLDGKSGKVSKDGEKYAVIPFVHNKNPSQQSAKAKDLADDIKMALRKEGLNWKKIETNSDGSPRLGRLHSFNFETARASEKHKNPLTYGVSVYQTKDKQTGKVRRDVMTFRVIKESHEAEGLWIHPGRPGNFILDEALKWAMEEWEQQILPAVLDKYSQVEK